jgi:hypothetical protein
VVDPWIGIPMATKVGLNPEAKESLASIARKVAMRYRSVGSFKTKKRGIHNTMEIAIILLRLKILRF